MNPLGSCQQRRLQLSCWWHLKGEEGRLWSHNPQAPSYSSWPHAPLLGFHSPVVLSSPGRLQRLRGTQIAFVWRTLPSSFPSALAWLLGAIGMPETNRKTCHWHVIPPAKGCPKAQALSQEAGVDCGWKTNLQGHLGTLWLLFVPRALPGFPSRPSSCPDKAKSMARR